MPSYDPSVNPISQAVTDTASLLAELDIALFGGRGVVIFDVLDDTSTTYPFVTLALGARAPSGSVQVTFNCHACPTGTPGAHELGAELERHVRDVLDATTHALQWRRSGPLVAMLGHATVQVFAAYPRWRSA